MSQLILSLWPGEKLQVGAATISISVQGNRLRVLVDAPRDVAVIRESAKVKR